LIVSASRRTDLPALYPDWLASRVKAGHAVVKNPFNPKQLRRVSLLPPPRGDMECLVLWTRNPEPILPEAEKWEKAGLRTLWLVTSTGYPPLLEPCAPSTDEAAAAVAKLSEIVGPERIFWRYDPIFICRRLGLDKEGHRNNFAALAQKFARSVGRCILSIYDDYAKARKRLLKEGLLESTEKSAFEAEALDTAAALAQQCAEIGLPVQSCCDRLEKIGIPPGACIDGRLIDKLWDLGVAGKKDPGQRPNCLCAPSVDIGAYNTCTHGCLYCYASADFQAAFVKRSQHDPSSECLS